MTCEGCSNAVKRVLAKQGGKKISCIFSRISVGFLDKVKSVDIDLDAKTVSVESSALSHDEIAEILKKTGKAVTAL